MRAVETSGSPIDVLGLLIEGHIDVLVEHRSEARTFLTESFFLDEAERTKIVAARDAYEQVFVDTIDAAKNAGDARSDLDPKLAAIYVLSILNAVERWYDGRGRVSRAKLTADIASFVCNGICGAS